VRDLVKEEEEGGRGRDGLATAGGVFLPNSVYRYPPMGHINRPYNSSTNSGNSIPGHVSFATTPSRTSLGQMHVTFGSSISALPTPEESNAFERKHGTTTFNEKDFGNAHRGALAQRLGRKISRIFVGKTNSAT
jgi:hypothetical protein